MLEIQNLKVLGNETDDMLIYLTKVQQFMQDINPSVTEEEVIAQAFKGMEPEISRSLLSLQSKTIPALVQGYKTLKKNKSKRMAVQARDARDEESHKGTKRRIGKNENFYCKCNISRFN